MNSREGRRFKMFVRVFNFRLRKHFKITLAFCAVFVAVISVLVEWRLMRSNDVEQDLDQSDVGSEHISIIGVRPLAEVVDELQPQFSLTSDEALQKAVPDTLNSSESSSSLSQFSLQVGLMATLLNSPGDSNANTSNRSTVLNLLTNFPFAPNVDPALQYKAAASLYEQVELLNRSLKDIPHFRGRAPFVVTVQISLIPYRHYAPYDTYAYLTFFTDPNEAPGSPNGYSETVPLVYPMPTADALEMSDDQQSRNQLQQLDLTLAAASHGVGTQTGYGAAKANNNTASGFDLNSLLTVGRLSQNCMEVRIGARNTPGAADQFNMVPETHNVTFLVYAPTNANELQMESHTVFRSLGNNELLTEMTYEKVEKEFLTNVLAGEFFDELSTRDRNKVVMAFQDDPKLHQKYEEFLKRLIQIVYDSNDYVSVSNNVKKSTFVDFWREFAEFLNYSVTNAGVKVDVVSDSFKAVNANKLDSLWLDTVRITGVGDQYDNDRVALPASMPEFPATNLTVICTDNGQSSVLIVSGGHRLESGKLHAILTCTNGFSFHSDLIGVTNSGTTLNIYFPLLSALTDSASSNSGAFSPSRLVLELDDNGSILSTDSYSQFAFYNPRQQDNQGFPSGKAPVPAVR